MCSAATSRKFSCEVVWRRSLDIQRTGHIGELEQRGHCENSARRCSHYADNSHQAAGLEQQSDQSTGEIQHSMSCEQPVFESKQWQTRRTRLQRPRWRTWTTANQFPKLRRGFRTHRPESRAGSERAVRTVGRCEDEARGDQAEGGQGQSEVEQTCRDNRRIENQPSGSTNAETEEMSVLTKTTEEMSVMTKTFEEKTVRQMSLAVDVVEMESERSEAESNLLAYGELAY